MWAGVAACAGWMGAGWGVVARGGVMEPGSEVGGGTDGALARVESLVRGAGTLAGREAVEGVLAGPIEPGSEGAALLSAIAGAGEVPEALFGPLAERTLRATAGERVMLLGAIGSIRTREAAGFLMGFVGAGEPEVVRRAAFAALEALSGEVGFGESEARWRAWYERVEPMGEGAWREALLGAHVRRGRAWAAERASAGARLADALRKLHLATPAEQRPALLAEWMLDGAPMVRELGFELVTRELASGGRINGPVGRAAVALLGDGSPGVRAAAASLVRQIAPADAGPAVVRALTRETDAEAAGALLLAAARWPDRASEGAVARWIAEAGQAQRAAIDAAAALARAGAMSAEGLEACLEALRRFEDGALTPAGVQMLAWEGLDADRDRVAELLERGGAEARRAAAEQLLWWPRYRGRILAAAAGDPALFDAAARAVWVQDPSVEEARAVLLLPRPEGEAGLAALTRVFARLPATELWALAQESGDVRLTRLMLESLTSRERRLSEGEGAASARAIAAGMVALAGVLVEANQPDRAAGVLGELQALRGRWPEAIDSAGLQRAEDLGVSALVAMGRVDDAGTLGGSAGAWYRGWVMMPPSDPQRSALARTLIERFGRELPTEAMEALTRHVGPTIEGGE